MPILPPSAETKTESVMSHEIVKFPCASKTVSSWAKGKAQWHEQCADACGQDSVFNLHNTFAAKPDVVIVLASADSTRDCSHCQAEFTTRFNIPWTWWTAYSRRSNGYFGCELLEVRKGTPSGVISWARLLTKHLQSETGYKWEKLNVVIYRSLNNDRTSILLFDASPALRELVVPTLQKSITSASLQDPFWPYEVLLHSVVFLQDDAVWRLRSVVRTMEMSRDASEAWKPDFPMMHDLARHAIHVCETLDVAVDVVSAMLSQHKTINDKLGLPDNAINTRHHSRTHSRIEFYQSMFRGLRSRSASNQQRLQNEIQLAFNTVSQRDAGDSLKLNHLMQADSTAMKTVAMLTLIFLPATFTAAIFSTSFFGINDEGTWVMSEKFWMYWAFAIPITVVTSFFWTRIKSPG